MTCLDRATSIGYLYEDQYRDCLIQDIIFLADVGKNRHICSGIMDFSCR